MMSETMMSCPTVRDLPLAPAGCHGWPWDVESERLPTRAPDGRPWPRISVVTPSYNQGNYLEETIRSVLLQGYPDLEYYIIDGGSSDQSVDIIRKYERWLAGWASEKDRGQSEAINKGFARCTGQWLNWICSDDLLVRGALAVIARNAFADPTVDVFAGACFLQYDDRPEKSCVRQVRWENWESAPYAGVIWQPSCFFRRQQIARDQLVRDDLHYCMDRELWAYLWSQKAVWMRLDATLSVFRFTGLNKTLTGEDRVIQELDEIHRSYFREWIPLPWLLRRLWLPLLKCSLRQSSPWRRILLRCVSRGVALVLLVFYCRKRVRALQADFYFHGGCVAMAD